MLHNYSTTKQKNTMSSSKSSSTSIVKDVPQVEQQKPKINESDIDKLIIIREHLKNENSLFGRFAIDELDKIIEKLKKL